MSRLLTWFRRIGAWVTRLTYRVTTSVHHIVVATTSRLVERWHTDGVYRRTLIAAASALSATVLPHPAAAAAVGALLADTHATPRRRGWAGGGEEYDDDQDDEFPPRHRWGAPRPVSLWEDHI